MGQGKGNENILSRKAVRKGGKKSMRKQKGRKEIVKKQINNIFTSFDDSILEKEQEAKVVQTILSKVVLELVSRQ